ncbi:BRISC and BRCA1-A complex member 1-like [Clavelina lepadiformis]|uniref:BRISC and BRCA1-A complex member 1 n=1 Tax=Clavelina lepadiformis TaxID=159417 RepID=A0ABP0GMV5_CLALP
MADDENICNKADGVEGNSIQNSSNPERNSDLDTSTVPSSIIAHNVTEIQNKETDPNEGDKVDKLTSSQEEDSIKTEIQASSSNASKPKIVLQRHPSASVEPRTLSKVNCNEKIILCVDHSATMFDSQFKRTIQSIKQSSVFHKMIGAIQQFVLTKSHIDKRHEFSLIMMNDDTQLITDFSNQGSEVLFVLQDIANDSQSHMDDSLEISKDFDLSNLFDLISRHFSLPPRPQSAMIPPPYTIRVIFVYGRSHGKLSFCNKQAFSKLTANPYFFVDSIYIHEEPDESNNVTDIFSCICELDTDGSSYILEVGLDGSMSALYNAFAKLLAHPLQRQKQIGNFDFIISE